MAEDTVAKTINGLYPKGWQKVISLCYQSDICLTRRMRPARSRIRKGKVADFVVAAEYIVSVKFIDEFGNERCCPIRVPKGFVTDLASLPWFARIIIDKAGRNLEASVVHDWCFVAWQVAGIKPNDLTEEMRLFADKTFLVALKKARVPCWRRWIMYLASRIGGQCKFYKEDCPIFADDDCDGGKLGVTA